MLFKFKGAAEERHGDVLATTISAGLWLSPFGMLYQCPPESHTYIHSRLVTLSMLLSPTRRGTESPLS